MVVLAKMHHVSPLENTSSGPNPRSVFHNQIAPSSKDGVNKYEDCDEREEAPHPFERAPNGSKPISRPQTPTGVRNPLNPTWKDLMKAQVPLPFATPLHRRGTPPLSASHPSIPTQSTPPTTRNVHTHNDRKSQTAAKTSHESMSSRSTLSSPTSIASNLSSTISASSRSVVAAEEPPILPETAWGFEVDREHDIVDEPRKKWAGLKRKLRYPISPTLLHNKSFAGYLTVCERQWNDMGALGKPKRRCLVIKGFWNYKDDKLFILRKPRSRYATDILSLSDCTIDPSPPKMRASLSAFALHIPHDVDEAAAGDTKAEKSGGRSFLIFGANEQQKMEWIGAILRASGWKGAQLAERGALPYITLHDWDTRIAGVLFPTSIQTTGDVRKLCSRVDNANHSLPIRRASSCSMEGSAAVALPIGGLAVEISRSIAFTQFLRQNQLGDKPETRSRRMTA